MELLFWFAQNKGIESIPTREFFEQFLKLLLNNNFWRNHFFGTTIYSVDFYLKLISKKENESQIFLEETTKSTPLVE